jgi:tRNA nucleotidyltransferase (CCA-adding enzyme)
MSAPNLPERLAGFQPPAAITEVLSGLKERGFRAFLVGGCVRDLLLGKPPKDFDIATSARPEEVQRTFRKVIPTGIEHGTVTVLSHGEHVEVTTFRKEGDYLDGRRPSTVEFHSEVEEDLSRRDFTINAMAFDPVGRALVDPFGGQADLEARVIRCVGAAFDRFSEDGLRPLRAVRFAAVLGFSLEPGTFAAIPRTLDVFRKVANERIREELSKLLLSERPELGARLLRETGLLQIFLPEALSGPEPFERRCAAVQAAPAVLEVRLGALLWGCPRARDALKRLTFPTKVLEVVVKLLENPLPEGLDVLSDAGVRRFFAKVGPELSEPVLLLLGALRGEARVSSFQARARAVLGTNPPLSPKDLALNGNAIMETLGVGPSRAVGEATRFLMEHVLEEPGLNDAETLARMLRNWAKDRGL